MKNAKKQIVTAASMAADIVSKAINLTAKLAYSVQANSATSGTLGGTFSLEGSIDYQEDLLGNVINPGTWNTVAGSQQTIAAAGVSSWDTFQSGFPWIRLRYTHFSGDTGTLNAFAYVKGNK